MDSVEDVEAGAFTRIVEEEWERVPEKYRVQIENVALLVEEKPSALVRKEEGLSEGETLLGLYHGLPLIERGEGYGTGPTMPDTITVYRAATMDEARAMQAGGHTEPLSQLVRQVVRDTLWHEIGHYFGWDDEAIERREAEGSNIYGQG